MLVHLCIQNFAIVERLDLDLTAGMTVITGETGAGKSIMLDALGLALGDRADSGVIRQGAEKTDILATFDISDIIEVKQWLTENQLDVDDQCLLRRTISRDGRSKAYINGTPCLLKDLKSVGEWLIDIHSQHEHQSLLKLDVQRRLLDEYAGNKQLADEVRKVAQRWRQIQQTLQAQLSVSEEQHARQALLQYQLEELDSLALVDGEVNTLEAELRILSQADQVLAACYQARTVCRDEEGNVLSRLNTVLKEFTYFKEPQTDLCEAINLLTSAQIQIDEAMGEVDYFIDQVELDPTRQQWVEERLDHIYRLARKHHVQPTELIALQQQIVVELDAMTMSVEGTEQLKQQLDLQWQTYQTLAKQLSMQRKAAAIELAKAVQQQMQLLGMQGGQFSIMLMPHELMEPQLMGNEAVEFLVSTNAGQSLSALNKVASGGELSRISLAIQVITAQTSRISTLVFDEVDVGVGGPTAEIVGQLLRQLGDRGQVLTVTHLPQVAAQGHQHLFVHKVQTKQETQTVVAALNNTQRIEEIARMLGGIDLTKESLAHAKKMLGQSVKSDTVSI